MNFAGAMLSFPGLWLGRGLCGKRPGADSLDWKFPDSVGFWDMRYVPSNGLKRSMFGNIFSEGFKGHPR